MQMRDVPIGDTVFLTENIDQEVRETYYRRTAVDRYSRLGIIQGERDSNDGACPWESGREAYRPRVVILSEEGYEYPLVGALPVHPLSASIFGRFHP